MPDLPFSGSLEHDTAAIVVYQYIKCTRSLLGQQ